MRAYAKPASLIEDSSTENERKKKMKKIMKEHPLMLIAFIAAGVLMLMSCGHQEIIQEKEPIVSLDEQSAAVPPTSQEEFEAEPLEAEEFYMTEEDETSDIKEIAESDITRKMTMTPEIPQPDVKTELEKPLIAGPSLERAVICKDVVNRTPLDMGDIFSADVGKLFCFTKVVGADGETAIKHVWYYEDTPLHEQLLMVKGPSWRTWSNKTIPSGKKGNWKVEIINNDNLPLETLSFRVE